MDLLLSSGLVLRWFTNRLRFFTGSTTSIVHDKGLQPSQIRHSCVNLNIDVKPSERQPVNVEVVYVLLCCTPFPLAARFVSFQIWSRPLGLAGVWGAMVEDWLDELLPADADKICLNRVHLLVGGFMAGLWEGVQMHPGLYVYWV